MMDFDFLVAMGYVARISPSGDLYEKEIKEAKYDIALARKSFSEGDMKWAIVKAYYAMFHSARGILLLLGFREKSHRGLAEVLEALSKQGKIESRFANDFRAAMSAREGADYSYRHSKDTAENLLGMADDFLARMDKLAKTIP